MKWLLLLSVLVLSQTANGQPPVVYSPPQRTITVSGSADILVAPDEVHLQFVVESREPKLDDAVKQNDTNTAAVLKFLKEAEIEAKDVQTDHVQIEPVFENRNGVRTLVPNYYQVRRGFGVRLRKVPQFDAVLTGVVRAGVNYVQGIEFRTTELRKHRDLARQKAIQAAKEKAQALAMELDVKVGKAQTISERTSVGSSRLGRSSPYGSMSQNIMQVEGRGAEPTEGNLAVGMISVSATIDVVFTLE